MFLLLRGSFCVKKQTPNRLRTSPQSFHQITFGSHVAVCSVLPHLCFVSTHKNVFTPVVLKNQCKKLKLLGKTFFEAHSLAQLQIFAELASNEVAWTKWKICDLTHPTSPRNNLLRAKVHSFIRAHAQTATTLFKRVHPPKYVLKSCC